MEVLGRAEWILSPEALAEAQHVGPLTQRRWRHPGLEDLLARPAGRQPDWSAALDSPEPVVGANAAIALARLGDPSGADRLAAAVRDPALPLPMRCAAAEALGELRNAAAIGLVRELTGQYGRPDPATDGGGAFYVAQLHAELTRALARNAAPEDRVLLLDALRSPSADVRLAALRAWMARCDRAVRPRAEVANPQPDGQYAHTEPWDLPLEVIDQRSHDDWRVRAAVLRLIGLQCPRRTHEYLEAALRDHDWRVRTAAIEALGLVGDQQARSVLAGLLADRSERIRAAAVDALAAAGERHKVLEAAGDESWRVRRQVARALAGRPDEPSASVARELLADPSAEVQLAVVEAVGQWPLERGGGLLLSAMDRPSLLTRQTATRCLAAQWPQAATFLPEAPPERRRELLDELRERLLAEFPALAIPEAVEQAVPSAGNVQAAVRARAAGNAQGPSGAQVAANAHAPANAQLATDAAVAAVGRVLALEDYDALGRFGPELVPALERIVFEFHQPLSEPVYREVLARRDPVFAALGQLASGGLMERRRAASQLAALAQQGPLPRLALERLVQLAAADPDVLVWQDALAVVGATGSDAAMRLAYAGLSHPEPEVRRRACELLAERPDPRHLGVLTPALEDRHPAVRLAAIRAWGLSGRAAGVEAPPALRRMVAGGSSVQRLEAAVALARAGDPSGKAALERLSYDLDPDVRRRVAQEMGELGDAAFVPLLVRLLDDRLSIARAALESLPKVVGFDVAEQQAPPAEDTMERMRRWREWFRRSPAEPAVWSPESPGRSMPP